MNKPRKNLDFSPEEISNLRKGIDLQREYFKRANIENNYEIMVKSLENIKSEIKHKAIAKNRKEDILRITKIINWYKTLEFRYTKQTPAGPRLIPPADIELRISKNLQIAYEITIEILGILGLI